MDLRTRRPWAANLARVTLAAAAMAAVAPAGAEKADNDKPTNIVFDTATMDDLHQVQVFIGDVIVTKGTIVIRADKLTVHQDPEGYQSSTAIANAGKTVYFRQKREGYADQFVEGTGERIEYDEKANQVKVFTNAIVRRLEGEKVEDEVRGNVITYNSETELYDVVSGPAGRAHAVLQPTKKDDTSATPQKATAGDVKTATPTKTTPGDAKPAPSQAAPGIVLKPATDLQPTPRE